MKRQPGMIVGAAVAIAAGILVLNNPGPGEFTQQALQTGGEQVRTNESPWTAMGEEMARHMFEENLVRTNFGVASVYAYNIDGQAGRVLAIGGRLIALKD